MTAHFVHLLDDLNRRVSRMAALVQDILQEAVESVLTGDHDLARRVVERDSEVDQEEVEIEAEVIRVMALYQPVGSDLRLLCAILKINNDLERIADCAGNVAARALYLDRKALSAHEDTIAEMATLVQRMLRSASDAFIAQNKEIAQQTFRDDDQVDDFYTQTIRRIVAEGSCSSDEMAGHLDVLSVAKNLERIADHATNIAEDVVFLSTGKIVRHGAASQ